MIHLDECLYIGNTGDVMQVDRTYNLLDVAQDLQCVLGWNTNGIEFMQVGLIDGPGNPPAAYVAAAGALSVLMGRARARPASDEGWVQRRTLVFDHEGGRALVVAIIYLNVVYRRDLPAPEVWDWWLGMLQERVDMGLPVPHPAHREAFDRIDWCALEKVIG